MKARNKNMLSKGDKIKLVAPMGLFKNIGEICEVIDVASDGLIWFSFGEGMHMGCMSSDEFEKYFEKYEEPKREAANIMVNADYVDWAIENSEIDVDTMHGKCTIVTCKLPNGFVIVESSSCVDPKNYDKELGVEICMERIANKIYELEAYHIQQTLWVNELEECGECEFCCECEECDECGLDECYFTDLDCDDCDNYDCEFNTRS
jgi:hypothetical protein